MKKMIISICVIACMCGTSFADSETPSITNKMITLKSNEHFKLLGDMQTKTGTRDGKNFKETKRLDTKLFAIYPSRLSNKGKFSGTGYLYICKVKILNKEWHPTASKRLLGNIGYQISEGLNVPLRSTTDTLMNEAGNGMVLLVQGEKATITLILIATEDKDIFHLCATYTESK